MSSDIVFGFGPGGPFRPFSLMGIALLAFVLAIVWAILATSRFAQGGVVEHEALRSDRAARNLAHARRSLVSSGSWLLVSVALFAFHWRWLARRRRATATVAPAAAV